MSMDKITIKAYIEYLQKISKETGKTMLQAHELEICKTVGRDYGVTEEELLWLNENL